VGDPQSPLEKLLEILDVHGLLAEDGWLRDEVMLVSVGDHFDYAGERSRVSQDGLELLRWLARHPEDQVVLLAGNHDLARVGELASYDDESFAAAYREARAIYDGKDSVDPRGDAEFKARHPELPTALVVARDYMGFSVAQRELVTDLLRNGRFRLALGFGQRVLVTHAGVARSDLELLGLSTDAMGDAASVADALDRALRRAVTSWDGRGRLEIPGLHTTGRAATGEGGGILYHRPCHPEHAGDERDHGPLRRRFDPRTIPEGLVQVIGHIRDRKCRDLLGEWSADRSAGDPAREEGELRHLLTDGESAHYMRGQLPSSFPGAAIVFSDGGMADADPSRYELLDLRSLRPVRACPPCAPRGADIR